MNVPAVVRASRVVDAVPPPDLAALAAILDQYRRARSDQIEALRCSYADRPRELAVARAVLRRLDAALDCISDGPR